MRIFLFMKIPAREILSAVFLKNFNVILCFFILALSGILAYRNIFGAPFIFDDLTQILQNRSVQSWDWPWAFLQNNRRPLLYFTLAVNYHFDGFNQAGYHIFNVRVHILASMMLFLIVRKTLLSFSLNEILKKEADLLALASAMIWLLHPIHTQAVTYIIQRAESLMGFLFLSAVYFSIRYFISRRLFWLIACGLTALLCGLTKEVALVLPPIVLLYDRTFVSKSFLSAFRIHRWLYAALSLTWGVMILLYFTTRPEEKLTAGFGMQGMSPVLYAINQPAVILHYIRLVFWPAPLVFDYYWPAQSQMRFVLPSILFVGAIVGGVMLLYRRFPPAGFLGASFFVLLLPSSSIIPLKDLIFEYRLYLSLVPTAVLIVLGIRVLAQKFFRPKSRQAFFIVCVSILSLVFGGLTFVRNRDYASEDRLWLDVIKKQPDNARAYNNLGEYWLRVGRDDLAEQYFLKSISLDARYPDVFANMAVVLGKKGHLDQAIEYARQAVMVDPDFAIGYNNLGSALAQSRQYAQAVVNFEKALALGFVREGVLINLAVALENSGNRQRAFEVLNDALRLYPSSQEVASILTELSGKTVQKK